MYFVHPDELATTHYVYWNPKTQSAVVVCGEKGRHGRCLRPDGHGGGYHMAQDGFTWTTTDTPNTTGREGK